MPIPHFFYVFQICYFIVNLYIFSHFWHIRFGRGNNSIFKLLLLALILVLPVHMSLQHFLNISIVPLKLVGFFYFVVMFYSAIYLLMMDLLKLLLTFLRLSNLFVRNYGLFLNMGLFLALLTTIAGCYMGTLISTPEYTVTLEKRSSSFERLRIVFVADLHLSNISDRNFAKRIVDKINGLNADLVLIPGDIIDRSVAELRYDFASDLRNISSRNGVFAVTGNHDYYEKTAVFRDFCRRSGISLIEDSSVVIENGLTIVGRNDRSYASTREGRKPLFAIMEAVDRSLPVILLDHTPFNLEQASENGISLQLSGHTHHGQLFPLQFVMDMLYKISRGHVVVKGSDIIVTSGVGFWGPPVRTSALPEIVVVNALFR